MRWNSLIKVIWLMVMVGIALISSFASLAYRGEFWVYWLFTGLSTVVLFFGFGRGAIFFDSFISVLLWLGFWLKFSVMTAFYDGRFNISVGAFDGSASSLDETLLVVCCAFAAVLLARFARQRFIFSYPDVLPDISYVGLFAFYRKFRVLIFTLFMAGVLVVCLSNAWFGIYQRGLVERVKLPLGLNGVYAWLLMFGMASVSSLILRFEFELNRDRYWIAIVIALVEVATSNISLWSRGMVLNGAALMYGALSLFRRKEPALRLGLAGLTVLVFGSLFVLSVLSVNYMRANTYYAGMLPAYKKNAVIEQTSTLFLDRWVGLEGVMSVVGSSEKGWPIFKEALSEKFDKSANSFYDEHFVDSSYDNASAKGTHFVSLPGYVAFLYYPGSVVFLFCAVFVFSLVAAVFELLVYRLGGKNLVLCALIAQVIAFRFTSFGYVPVQSYMLFGSIIANVMILFLSDKMFRSFYKI